MSEDVRFSRRRLLGSSVALAGIGAAGALVPGIARALESTFFLEMGPFYPVAKPLDQDADLTIVAGRTERAKGQILHFMGRVLNRKGEPVAGARLEVWQANTFGRYDHPSDPNPAPLDPNFQGSATLMTDAEGRFRFKTIKPGPYPTANPNVWRPPHIHFDVSGKADRLVTQVFFPGEPMNEGDFVYQAIRRNKDGSVCKYLPPAAGMEPDSRIAYWDIVLPTG